MHKACNKTLKAAAKWLLVSMVIGGLALSFQVTSAFARERARISTSLIPEYWTPSLDQLKYSLEESAKAEPQAPQQAINQTSQNLADVIDAQLFILYIQLLQTLDSRGRATLFMEQAHWLEKRIELASAAVTSKGGSLAPLEYSSAFSKITEARLTELQKRLTLQHNNKQPKK